MDPNRFSSHIFDELREAETSNPPQPKGQERTQQPNSHIRRRDSQIYQAPPFSGSHEQQQSQNLPQYHPPPQNQRYGGPGGPQGFPSHGYAPMPYGSHPPSQQQQYQHQQGLSRSYQQQYLPQNYPPPQNQQYGGPGGTPGFPPHGYPPMPYGSHPQSQELPHPPADQLYPSVTPFAVPGQPIQQPQQHGQLDQQREDRERQQAWQALDQLQQEWRPWWQREQQRVQEEQEQEQQRKQRQQRSKYESHRQRAGVGTQRSSASPARSSPTDPEFPIPAQARSRPAGPEHLIPATPAPSGPARTTTIAGSIYNDLASNYLYSLSPFEEDPGMNQYQGYVRYEHSQVAYNLDDAGPSKGNP